MRTILSLQDHYDFVSWDSTLAENLPAAGTKREVDDGGGQAAAGWPAVDDERDAVADLIAHAAGMRTLAGALQIGRSGRDGQAEAFDDGTGNGRVGHAQCDVARIGRGTQRQLAAGTHDDGERTGPEAVGQLVEHGVRIARQRIRLRETGDEQRKGLVLLPGLELINALNGAQVHRIDGKSVKSIGRQSDDISLTQAGDDVIYPVLLGFIGMDAQDFRGQEGPPQFPGFASKTSTRRVDSGCIVPGRVSPAYPGQA